MTYAFRIKTLVAAMAIAIVGNGASALSVNFTSLSHGDLSALTVVANPTANSTTGTVLQGITGSVPGVNRSPWQGSANDLLGTYTSVQAGSTATYLFSAAQDVLELIWGSPDNYNNLTITLSGTGGTQTINGTAVQGPVAILAAAVRITGFSFDTVTFESTTNNAFEFANFQVSTVPLPAAAWMLLAGLGGLTLVARRRKEV